MTERSRTVWHVSSNDAKFVTPQRNGTLIHRANRYSHLRLDGSLSSVSRLPRFAAARETSERHFRLDTMPGDVHHRIFNTGTRLTGSSEYCNWKYRYSTVLTILLEDYRYSTCYSEETVLTILLTKYRYGTVLTVFVKVATAWHSSRMSDTFIRLLI